MNFNFFDLFWVFLVLSSFVPIFQRMRIANARNSLIRQFEKKRDSRLITLIHRQEALSFLGLAFARFIDIEDSEQVLRAIRLTSTGISECACAGYGSPSNGCCVGNWPMRRLISLSCGSLSPRVIAA